jgi:hypothetical protein
MGVGFDQILRASIATLVTALAFCMPPGTGVASEPEFRDDLAPFFDLLSADTGEIERAFRGIDNRWHDGYAPMLLEVQRFTRDPDVVVRLVELLHEGAPCESS